MPQELLAIGYNGAHCAPCCLLLVTCMKFLAAGQSKLSRRAMRRASLQTVLVPALLLLLTLGLLLAGASLARPGVALQVDQPEAARTLVRFYGVEQNASDTYRWSEPLAGAFLYGFEGRPALVSLRLTAPRPLGAEPTMVHARSGGVELGAFVVAPGWRQYRLLAPSSSAGESALLLETPAYQPPDDPRQLGLVLSAVQITSAADGSASLPLVRALYLLAIPLLGWLLLARGGAPLAMALGLGVLLACLVGWAAANPTRAGYWLPTLGWPWWPLLPLVLLVGAAQLKRAEQAARSWLDARPGLGWAGLGLGLVALLGLRNGLPPLLGLAALALGVWAGLGNVERRAQNLEQSEPTFNSRGGIARIFQPSLLVLLITALALALRLINLDGQPAGLWRDESRHGLQALRIWSDPSYRPIYVVEGADLPALLFYLMAPVVGLLGPHPWSARLVSALAGGLMPLALYWAAGPLVGRRAALLGAALLAWASWGLSMSRWAFPATLDHLLVLVAVGLLWRALGDAPAPDAREEAGGATAFLAARVLRWPQLAALALAGLLGGLAVYAYHTGRVAPLALAAVAVLRLGFAPSTWRRALPGLLVATLVGALTVAPLVAYVANDAGGYNRRVGSVSILDSNDPAIHSPAGLLLDNLGRYLLMFHWRGESNGRHHLPEVPMLDPLSGLLLAVGVCVAWRAVRKQRGAAALLALAAIYLIPGVFSGNAPHAMRSLGTLAPVCALAGLGLAGLLGGNSLTLSRPLATSQRWRQAFRATLLVGGPLLVSLLFNLWLYFGAMRVEPRVYGEFDLLETTMGRVVQAAAENDNPALRAVRVYLPDALRGEDTLRFLAWGLPTYGYTGAALPADGPALLLLPGNASAAAQSEALAALGPGAVPLGPVAVYPGTERPIVLAFGRGDAARLLLATQTAAP